MWREGLLEASGVAWFPDGKPYLACKLYSYLKIMLQPPTNLFIIGSAGSGKSTLTGALSRWLREDGKGASCVNLDPGVEHIPYSPSYDVREMVKVEEIMGREGLGPNGALIRAAEVLESRLEEVAGGIEARCRGSEYRILDTPGQMEVFIYRDLGPRLVSAIEGRVVAISLMDPSLLRQSSDLVALRLTSLIVELRLGVPVVEVMSKADIFGADSLVRLEEGLEATLRGEGLRGELAQRLEAAMSPLRKRRRLIAVSEKGTGLEELYKAVGESACACGDQS